MMDIDNLFSQLGIIGYSVIVSLSVVFIMFARTMDISFENVSAESQVFLSFLLLGFMILLGVCIYNLIQCVINYKSKTIDVNEN